MKKNYLNGFSILLNLVLCSELSVAQNLVPNHGFDTYEVCPSHSAQTTLTPPWFEPVGSTTDPDYMNACFHGGNQSTPTNYYGYQKPVSDSGYYGMIAWYLYSETREYMSVRLINPLTAGVAYKVGFYVSLADNFQYAVDHFGAHLSVGQIYGSGNFLALSSYIPQIDHGAGNLITDTTNWTYISGLYTAAGGEDYITIGNFYDDANTLATQVNFSPLSLFWGYYYVDEVSVEPNTVTGIEGKQAYDFTMFPNPFSNQLTMTTNSNEVATFTLYDISSRKLLREDFYHTASINTEDLARGVYFYEVSDKSGLIKKGKVVKD